MSHLANFVSESNIENVGVDGPWTCHSYADVVLKHFGRETVEVALSKSRHSIIVISFVPSYASASQSSFSIFISQTTDAYVLQAYHSPTGTGLRSGSCPRLIVPRTRLSTIGDRSFRVTVARAWNSLPTSITALTSLPSFKRQLKTFLFTKSFPSV